MSDERYFNRNLLEQKILTIFIKKRIVLLQHMGDIEINSFSTFARKFIYKILKTYKMISFLILKQELEKHKKIKKGAKNNVLFLYKKLTEKKVKDDDIDYAINNFKSFITTDKIVSSIEGYLKNIEDGMVQDAEGKLYSDLFKIKSAQKDNILKGEIAKDLKERVEHIIKKKENPEVFMGIKTGFKTLDNVTGGLWGGELGIIFGITGLGKSIFVLNLAHNARKQQKNVLLVINEEPKLQVEYRYDSCLTGIKYKRFKFAQLTNEEMTLWKKKIKKADDKYGKLYIISVPRSCTVSHIDRFIEEYKELGIKIDILFVDYLDRLQAEKRSFSEQHELGVITDSLKDLALYWNIPVWTITQLKFASVEKEMFDVTDIGYSAKKAHSADLVGAILETEQDKEEGLLSFQIVKYREAGKKMIKLKPNLDSIRIREYIR